MCHLSALSTGPRNEPSDACSPAYLSDLFRLKA